MADPPSSLEWPADKLYEACGALLAAKEKHREEHFGSISMSDFVGVYFEHMHGSRLDAQRQAASFARGIQAHWAHSEFGARIYTFGLLCGLLLFEGDSPNAAATLNKSPLGASAEACTVVLDSLRALLNGPLFQPPQPLIPPTRGSAAHDKSASNKPWRRAPSPSLRTSTTAPASDPAHPNSPPTTAASASSPFSNVVSRYPADLAYALNPPPPPASTSTRNSSRRGMQPPHASSANASQSPSPLLPASQSLSRACVWPFQRDLMRRALAQTAAEAKAKARIRSGALQLLQGGGANSKYDLGLPKPLVQPDASGESTGEGRLRQVLMRELPGPAVDALCDTIWADAIPPSSLPAHTSSSFASFMQRKSSSSLSSSSLEPDEVLVNLDGFMERVLTAWLSVKLASIGAHRSRTVKTGQQYQQHMYSDSAAYRADVESVPNDTQEQQFQQQQQQQQQQKQDAVAAAAAHEEAVRVANEERAAKKKALEELALGEKIEYEEASAVAFDWALVFDSDGNDVSFEEARALFRRLKTEPCVTLTLRFLTRPTLTTRCAPADTIAQVKARISSRLKKQSSSSSSSSSLIGKGGAGTKRHHSNNKPLKSGSGTGGDLDRGGREGKNEDDEELVMVQFGVELPSHSTVEASGLHNNASVEMIELDLWKSMLELRLDEKPDTTRGRPGAAAHRAFTSRTTRVRATRGGGGNSSHASVRSTTTRAHSPLFSPPPGRSTANIHEVNRHGNGNGSSVFLNASSVDSFGFGAANFERGDLPLPRPPDPAVAQALLMGGRPPYRPPAIKGESSNGDGMRQQKSSSLGPMETLRFKLRTGGKPWQPPK